MFIKAKMPPENTFLNYPQSIFSYFLFTTFDSF